MRKAIAVIVLIAVGLGLSGVAGASEATVKAAVQKKYPQISIEGVTKTPLPGIYEVLTDGQLIYSNEDASYLFINASLVDTSKKINVTQERLNKLTAIKFNDLPFDLAFKKVKGNGARKLAVFADPDCPFCKQIEGDLAKLNNVTIYMFLYPIEALHPNATDHAKRVWCSPDRVKAWDDIMQKGIVPTAAPNCNTPVEKLVEWGNRNRINGTPTLIFADGTRAPGAIPAEQIEQRMASAAPSK